MALLKRVVFAAVLLIVVMPGMALADSIITGVVTDTSGAVVPGVTVEASSPALIEQTRSVVTDSNGVYRIVDLRPGPYKVTFTLTGFSTVVRDGIILETDFTATINAQLRVGSVEESITVSGASPVVDVQNTQSRAVISSEQIEQLPSGRSFQSLSATVPANLRARCMQCSKIAEERCGSAPVALVCSNSTGSTIDFSGTTTDLAITIAWATPA